MNKLKHYLIFKGAVQIDFFLRDGIRICQLMNKIKENSINKQEIITGNIDAHRGNIQAFIKAARTYGVPDKYLFEAGDKISKFLHMNPPGPLKILTFRTLSQIPFSQIIPKNPFYKTFYDSIVLLIFDKG